MGDAGQIDELTQTIMNLMSNAVNASSTYVKHANRTQITPTDIRMGLMVDFVAWDLLKDRRPKVEAMEEGVTMQQEATEEFTPSTCKCIVCTTFNLSEQTLRNYAPKCEFSATVKEKLLDADLID